jgi:Kef-type K+ transport system membrane component KefB
MEAICFGFFVPFFFVVSGINLDVGALLGSAKTLLLVPAFLALFLIVRGVPVVLYRRDLPRKERWPFVLYSTTALPMVIAIAAIEVRTERMQSDIAAALVGAGLLSVLLFPAIASALLSRIDRSSSTSQGGNEREEISSPETPKVAVKGFYPVMIYNLLAEIPLRRRIWADSAE